MSETDLQIEVEHILRSFFEEADITYEPHHNINIFNGRPDPLYGKVTIEYKKPGFLDMKSKYQYALNEVQAS